MISGVDVYPMDANEIEEQNGEPATEIRSEIALTGSSKSKFARFASK